jgi:hypothetical protein
VSATHSHCLRQDQLKAEIVSLQTWLAECDGECDAQSTDVVKEEPLTFCCSCLLIILKRQVEFACKQSTMLLQEFDEAVLQYQVPEQGLDWQLCVPDWYARDFVLMLRVSGM